MGDGFSGGLARQPLRRPPWELPARACNRRGHFTTRRIRRGRRATARDGRRDRQLGERVGAQQRERPRILPQDAGRRMHAGIDRMRRRRRGRVLRARGPREDAADRPSAATVKL